MTRNRDDIRREMRARRRLVTRQERELAARCIATGAERAYLIRPGYRIAVYHPFGHEADVTHVTGLAWRRGCEVYLPVVMHQRRFTMQFVRFRPDARLKVNMFGIPEPDDHPQVRIPPLRLDVIFMPLVAFDEHGWRLGSGAGYYDRRLQHLRGSRQWRRPKLVGVAYEHQRLEALSPGAWDVPMDAVLTERHLYRFDHHRNS
jgi:5-formyltetrahydrofolate cyclo-ligase